MPSKIPIAAVIIGAIVIIGAVLILLFYEGTDKVVVAGLYATIIGVVFGYLQSVTNTAKIAAIEPAVKEAAETLAVIAPAVEKIAPLVDQVATLDTKADKTGKAVDGAVHEWMAVQQQLNAMVQTNAAQEKRIAVMEATQIGIEQGKAQLLEDTAAMAVAVANDPDAPVEPAK